MSGRSLCQPPMNREHHLRLLVKSFEMIPSSKGPLDTKSIASGGNSYKSVTPETLFVCLWLNKAILDREGSSPPKGNTLVAKTGLVPPYCTDLSLETSSPQGWIVSEVNSEVPGVAEGSEPRGTATKRWPGKYCPIGTRVLEEAEGPVLGDESGMPDECVEIFELLSR